MPNNLNEQGVQKKLEELQMLNKRLTEERNLLRAVIDNYPDSIYVKDAAARKTLANLTNIKNTGHVVEADVLGKSDFDLFIPEVAARLFEDDQRVLQGESIINREERLVNNNGEVYWMVTTKIPRRDAEGKIIGIIGGGRNITRQKEAELKLIEERNLLRAVIDNLPDAIYVKDLLARKTLANAADVRNTGCKTEAEVLGKTDFDFFARELAERFFEDDQVVIQKGRPVVNREEKITESANSAGWLLTTKIPWRDANGNIIGLVGIGRNITDKKNLEAQVVQSQRMESVVRLATGIAHDLNNTLAPILISVELLRQKIHDDDGLHVLTAIETSARRAAETVKQILSFSREIEGQRTSVKPCQIAHDAARIAAQTLPKNIRIETEVGENLWPVLGNPVQLRQVLLNLCTNAAEAMPDGGPVRLAVRNVAMDSKTHSIPNTKPHVLLEVSDAGVGIAPEFRDRIFEPFFTTKKLGAKRVGLGLSTALSIVKSHQGSILVKSDVGKGSTFQVYLPAHGDLIGEKPPPAPA